MNFLDFFYEMSLFLINIIIMWMLDYVFFSMFVCILIFFDIWKVNMIIVCVKIEIIFYFVVNVFFFYMGNILKLMLNFYVLENCMFLICYNN